MICWAADMAVLIALRIGPITLRRALFDRAHHVVKGVHPAGDDAEQGQEPNWASAGCGASIESMTNRATTCIR